MSAQRLATALVGAVLFALPCSIPVGAQDRPTTASRPKRLLLLAQSPDSHPKTTHEYLEGNRVIARLLQGHQSIQTIVVLADSPWPDGPELLENADGVLLFLTEGAKWISADDKRLAAFQRLAQRGGGLTCLHWGMGTRDTVPVTNFVSLFGGCHGGPDRKYKVTDFQVSVSSSSHPTTSGILPFEIHDEFYYDLKWPASRVGLTPLLHVRLDDVDFPVAWAWERPDTGRSFGFTGLHFHENWRRLEYRRLVAQGILWTLHEPIPAAGLTLDVSDAELTLPATCPGK